MNIDTRKFDTNKQDIISLIHIGIIIHYEYEKRMVNDHPLLIYIIDYYLSNLGNLQPLLLLRL
jgi:hypothetical protein